MAVVEISVVPIGTSGTGLSAYVAGCVKMLAGAVDVKYQLTPMGTIIEGDLDRVLELVRQMHEQPFNSGIARVLTTIRIDDRRDQHLTMAGKVAAVQEKL